MMAAPVSWALDREVASLVASGSRLMNRSLKLTLPSSLPIGGMMRSLTMELTTLPNAPPMMTPMAICTTLPRSANSLNSLSNPIAASSGDAASERSLLRLEHEQIGRGGAAVGVGEILVVGGVDPDGVGLARLQLHGQNAGALVFQVLRLTGGLGIGGLGFADPGPAAVGHVLAEGDFDFVGLGIDVGGAGLWERFDDNGAGLCDGEFLGAEKRQ